MRRRNPPDGSAQCLASFLPAFVTDTSGLIHLPDFMIAIGQFLDGSLPQSAALWALSNIPGFPPIIQSVHILGIAVVMGSIVMLDLRILGLAVPAQQLPEMARRLMPWLWCALASNLFSGSFFVFARPLRYFNNPVFRLEGELPAFGNPGDSADPLVEPAGCIRDLRRRGRAQGQGGGPAIAGIMDHGRHGGALDRLRRIHLFPGMTAMESDT